MPEAVQEIPKHPAELRFQFLFPAEGCPRFVLHAPDCLELSWTVFDRAGRRTVARSSSPEGAVDYAMEQARFATA